MQYLLKKFNKNHFYFVQTANNSCLCVVQIDKIFYDIYNHDEIHNAKFSYMKPLTDYVSIDNELISIVEAKRHYKLFKNSFIQSAETSKDVNNLIN